MITYRFARQHVTVSNAVARVTNYVVDECAGRARDPSGFSNMLVQIKGI